MTPDEIAALYPPTSDVKTHRQVFFCPGCGERLLGPEPGYPRPTWVIPLLCCAREPMRDDWWLDKPPTATVSYKTLELRKHVWGNRRTRERFDIWLPAL